MRATTARIRNVVVEIASLPIQFSCENADFVQLIVERYSEFLSLSTEAVAEFEVALTEPDTYIHRCDLQVTNRGNEWLIERSDFRAIWNPSTGRGRIQQAASIYAFDSVLRVVHTLMLPRMGGFLLHASSFVWNNRALLFSGAAGTGKTTIAKLAPPGASLLSDDVSCVARKRDSYNAIGTPFYCGLGRSGKNLEAHIETLYLLAQASESKIEAVESGAAIRGLMENIICFVRDPQLVKLIFETACDFVSRIPVRRVTFAPNVSVWDIIQ